MIPVHCMVRHDEAAGIGGDCVRACIASILELSYDEVPHFYDRLDVDGDEGERRIQKWLLSRNASLFRAAYPGIMFEHLMEFMSRFPDLHYMLSGELVGGGCHMVVCRGGAIVHDPAWYSVPFAGPPVENGGQWLVDIIVKA